MRFSSKPFIRFEKKSNQMKNHQNKQNKNKPQKDK